MDKIERTTIMTKDKDAEIPSSNEWDGMSADQIISILTKNADYDWENDNPVVFMNHLLNLGSERLSVISALKVLEGKLRNAQESGVEKFAMMLGFFLSGVEYKISTIHENTENWSGLDTDELVSKIANYSSRAKSEFNINSIRTNPEDFMNLIAYQQSSIFFDKGATIIAGLHELKSRENSDSDLWKMLHFFLSGVDFLRK